ncbi:DNA polymerase II large subunit [Candidatus Pacearchaeota archaeon]|nr:DNA polymerase II large subunit [Candidatus Pacearchaeota archaeon]
MSLNQYFKEIEDKVRVAYSIAQEARNRELDPVSIVEIPLARSLAEKVTALVSVKYPQVNNPELAKRILSLEKEHGQLNPIVSIIIAEEISNEKFCKFRSKLEAIDAGIRIGLAYTTMGVVSSPLEGFTDLKLGKTAKGAEYFKVYFSGPIRSAGGTAAAFCVVLADYLREKFGYAKYDATEQEVKRTVTEVLDYHERITNLQYLPSEKEVEIIARNLPVQVTGEPSEDKEVSNYKDIERIETNLLRSGFCLVIAEGIAQKAAKLIKIIRGLRDKNLSISSWDFLQDITKLQKKEIAEAKPSASSTFIKDIVAGRPIFTHPSRPGGFRLRYGRTRTSGYSAVAIHPSTMILLENFIAIGTQFRMERPGKSAAVVSCDSIEAPLVKLNNGSVINLKEIRDTERFKPEVKEVLYLGDILISYGDFINRNHVLMPVGYTEEQWVSDLKPKTQEKISPSNIDIGQVKKLSQEFNVPLHPAYIFYWSQLCVDDILLLLEWLKYARFENKIILPYERKFDLNKRALEILGVPHIVTTENVVISEKDSLALMLNLGIEKLSEIVEISKNFSKLKVNNGLDFINKVSKFKIKDKAGTFIGARMGRPEKAKLRKLTGSPNVLFPVGEAGGRLRSVQEAAESTVKADFPIYFCNKCNAETIYFICENCGERTGKMYYCKDCDQKIPEKHCHLHGENSVAEFTLKRVDMQNYFNAAVKHLNFQKIEIPEMIKGVKGTSSGTHIPENLAKGFLRAMFNLCVNKDGTIRYDCTELPITYFKPKEIGTPVEKLIELDYIKDINGQKLVNEEQILEIKPHDVILPCCPDSLDENADFVFQNIANFIDSLLVRFYGLKPFYELKRKEDLIGHLVTCIAPHNSACVVGRIIGFSKIQALLASPFMHAAMRRDCVYPTTKLFFYDAKNKEIFYEGLGDYVEKLIKERAETKKIDSFGTLKVDINKKIYALGIDPYTHELKKKKIKYFIKGPETKEWIKITTATNREYMMTPSHKFMFVEGNNFRFKEAKNATVGDQIPVLENFNFKLGISSIDIVELFKEKLTEKEKKEIIVIDNKKEQNLNIFSGIANKSFKLRHKFSHHKIPAILNINEDLMRLFGYYSAEGYSRINKWVGQVSFRICNKDMQTHIEEIIKRVFGIKASLGEDNTKITICSKLIYYLFKSLGIGKGAYDKRSPRFIFGLDENLVREYISAFFEGDGSVIKTSKRIVFYSVSRDLLDDIALLLSKFHIIGRYFRTEPRLPGKRVLERYKELRKKPKKHTLNHLILGVHDSFKLSQILHLINRERIEQIKYLRPAEKRYLAYGRKQILLKTQSDYFIDYVKKVEVIRDTKNSYCVEIEWKEAEDRNVLWGEQIINTRCDGDEAAVMLLLDMLINFSKQYLPAHRGATQDAPLILNARLRVGEVDDMVFDMETVKEFPSELYEAAERFASPASIKVPQVKSKLLEGDNAFEDMFYTHETSDINLGVTCSAYKKLATMQEKVQKQMLIVEKIRAVDAVDVAKLVIERHLIRDIRGNLRKFSMQQFRCVKCNEKYRRPPLAGVCSKCGGKIIFTISEGGIIKYLEPALQLATKYEVPGYIRQSLELTKKHIESIFGRETEKQEALQKWF